MCCRKDRQCEFYVEFNKLWSWKSENKGEGVVIDSRSNVEKDRKVFRFQKLCIAIQSVFDAPLAERDNVVAKQIDWLKECGVSTRGSVFSEMLCQEYPDRYPVLNAPIKKFLEKINLSLQKEQVKALDILI